MSRSRKRLWRQHPAACELLFSRAVSNLLKSWVGGAGMASTGESVEKIGREEGGGESSFKMPGLPSSPAGALLSLPKFVYCIFVLLT